MTKRILIVDDEEAIRELACGLLVTPTQHSIYDVLTLDQLSI